MKKPEGLYASFGLIETGDISNGIAKKFSYMAYIHSTRLLYGNFEFTITKS